MAEMAQTEGGVGHRRRAAGSLLEQPGRGEHAGGKSRVALGLARGVKSSMPRFCAGQQFVGVLQFCSPQALWLEMKSILV